MQYRKLLQIWPRVAAQKVASKQILIYIIDLSIEDESAAEGLTRLPENTISKETKEFR